MIDGRFDCPVRSRKEPLIRIEQGFECRIERRVNRFVVQVFFQGQAHPAAINNTGRLKELIVRGKKALCVPNPHGKTWAKLVAVEDDWGWALIDTQRQMQAFERAQKCQLIPWLANWTLVKRNPRLGKSVLDFYLRNQEGVPLILETKSAVFREGCYATYPDCPSVRGQRHLRELTDYARSGGSAAVVFVAALAGVNAFKPAVEGDPVIALLLKEALGTGLVIRAVHLELDQNGVIFLTDSDLPVMADW